MSNSKYWDGKGEPEVGQLARVFINPARPASESLKRFAGLDVEIINKFYFDGDLIVVIYNLKFGHTSISAWGYYLVPFKSEREIEIEEMEKVIYSYSFNNGSLAEHLYDAGLRVERPQ